MRVREFGLQLFLLLDICETIDVYRSAITRSMMMMYCILCVCDVIAGQHDTR